MEEQQLMEKIIKKSELEEKYNSMTQEALQRIGYQHT